MLINARHCPKCNYVIFSRVRHDFRWCKCKTIGIDGGQEYEHLTFKKSPKEALRIQLDISITPKELFDDWNLRYDKWGFHQISSLFGRIVTEEKPRVTKKTKAKKRK